jgi:hypothetical protein
MGGRQNKMNIEEIVSNYSMNAGTMQKPKMYSSINLEELTSMPQYMDSGEKKKMTIIDLPESNLQIHIKEGERGTCQYKQVGPSAPLGSAAYTNMTSEQGARADLLAEKLKMHRYFTDVKNTYGS